MEKSKRIFLIFTAVFLGLILLTGIVLGALSIIRDALSVMNYKGIYLYEGMANYLSASYKNDFMATLKKAGINCYDDERFWRKKSESGKTYGEILKENTEEYIKSVLVGSYLFDRNTRLSKEDKALIKKSIEEVLDYKAGGDVDRFNEIGRAMGFDYRDFKKVAKLIYKSEMAKTVVFGFDGSALKSVEFSAECDAYFNSNYSRVRLLIIRTDGRLVTDPDTGREKLEEYDSTEKAEALAKIQNIRERIADGQMNEDAFKQAIALEYPTATANDEYGYYFSSSSAYSKNFAKEGGEPIVKAALSAKIGDYVECELDIGVCFVYKRPLVPRAYASYSLSHFFDDFYINAVPYVYERSLVSYLSDVKVKKKYNYEAVLTQPYNYELGISFG